MTLRDAYFNQFSELAKSDTSLVLVTADMSAPALDYFRRTWPSRYVNVGVAEQAAVLVAAGMAMEGWKPVVYGIQNFISLRACEQLRVAGGLLDLPLTVVGYGAGFSYAGASPTHYAVDDMTVVRMVPGVTVWNPSSPAMAAYCARHVGSGFQYVRLERGELPNTHYRQGMQYTDMDDMMKDGYIVHAPHKKRYVVTTGGMVWRMVKVVEEVDAGLVEVFRIPCDVVLALGKRQLAVVEEHHCSGLGGWMRELLPDRVVHCKGVGDKKKDFVYGGRDSLLRHNKLHEEDVVRWLKELGW